MRLKPIRAAALDHGLEIYGIVHPDVDDYSKAASLALLGPSAQFWTVFSASDIYQDGLPDPIDRWSTRAVSAIAEELDAKPIFPFGGPPYAPFMKWALQSGRAWHSPVSMLVHEMTGLMVSYRGALAFSERLDIAARCYENPCDTCADKPCQTACPIDAIDEAGYNVIACHEYLETGAGSDCLDNGCQVRRACPASVPQRAEQAALHMRAFQGK